jgi:uncharacterized protein
MDISDLTRRAESGQCVAQTTLGMYYLHGEESVAVDYHKAFRLLSMAAEQRATRAIANLAHMYANGLGVDRDVTKAIQLYEQVGAVEFFAALELARIYANGVDHPRDSVKAVKWYSVVVSFGDEKFDHDSLGEEINEARAYIERFDERSAL